MPVNDHYSVSDYGRMIADGARTAPFVDALRRTVRPGSVVLEIGTGPGFFALLACQFGAVRVYAVEPDNAIDIGRESAHRLGLNSRIVWLRGLSTEIDLPEPVDVVIGDLHGTLPFYTGNIASMIDARTRHLRPGGTMIPLRDTVFAVPAEAADEYMTVVEPWEHNGAGVELSPGRRFVVNQWWRAATASISEDRYFAAPTSWAEIDYGQADSPNAAGRCDWTARREGVMHGYYVWFDSDLGNDSRLSNAPTLPELVYGRAFFPLERSIALSAGDRIRCDFAANLVADEYVMRWSTRIDDAAGAHKASFAQSDFMSRPRLKEDLDRSRPDYRPTLAEAGSIELCVLKAMSDGETLARIADRLARDFPKRFPDISSALRRATDLSLKFGEP